ncbi:hypothetical protein [Nonomuraea sp. NPDC050643]|uniref:hypothetical protein n=1 Tax=Nonomuraea sp. NPDC050643 TaxID=3155660 RepID=UPI00340AC1D5
MSASDDRADELQAQVDALRRQAVLEKELLDAKASGDRTAIQEAAETLREARSQTRPKGMSVGGDAFVSNPEEG